MECFFKMMFLQFQAPSLDVKTKIFLSDLEETKMFRSFRSFCAGFENFFWRIASELQKLSLKALGMLTFSHFRLTTHFERFKTVLRRLFGRVFASKTFASKTTRKVF